MTRSEGEMHSFFCGDEKVHQVPLQKMYLYSDGPNRPVKIKTTRHVPGEVPVRGTWEMGAGRYAVRIGSSESQSIMLDVTDTPDGVYATVAHDVTAVVVVTGYAAISVGGGARAVRIDEPGRGGGGLVPLAGEKRTAIVALRGFGGTIDFGGGAYITTLADNGEPIVTYGRLQTEERRRTTSLLGHCPTQPAHV